MRPHLTGDQLREADIATPEKVLTSLTLGGVYFSSGQASLSAFALGLSLSAFALGLFDIVNSYAVVGPIQLAVAAWKISQPALK